MAKKQTKSKEEKLAENYFPIDESSVARSTEKVVKEFQVETKTAIEKPFKKLNKKDIEKVEKVSKKKAIRKKTSRRTSKKKTTLKKVDYKPAKISLKKNGYELIVTEKPQAALKIASALGKSERKGTKGVFHYEINRNGKEIIVACAVGHLFTLKQIGRGNFPAFEIQWTPNFIARKKDFTKKYHDTILRLAKNAGSITIATDYDIEGEVIGLNVTRFICGQKDASRMKFSTLTQKEIEEAYENKASTLNWGQAIAGETRHYLDWFYGINLSRALMNAIKTTGQFKIMSIGRVQGPALDLIAKKEKEIQKFKPQPYWQVSINVDDGKNQLELKHNKDLFEEKDLDKFKDLKRKNCKLQTDEKDQFLPPNPPFNLTTLQTEAYKFHGIKPSRTLQIAQSLYLAGLISYPRTSSQKIPESIDYRTILKKILKKFKAEKLATKDKPLEGKKSDPAHPSIYPTGETQTLAGDDEKIYNLIAKRFISVFCEEAVIANKKISTEIDKLKFATKGISIKKKSWMQIYPSKIKENTLPKMKEDAVVEKVKQEQKETQPPRRYSPASILSELEKRNLGTKATRAAILETLYDRGYVQDTSIKATPLGISLIDTLEKYSPIIIEEKLTRDFEKEMENIQNSKKGFVEKEEKTLEKAKESIREIAKDFEKNQEKIGGALMQANTKLREQQKEENKLNLCPVCGKGHLGITYSRKTKRYFVACDAYPNCKTTFSLPPNGTIKKTEKICEECGFPKLMRLAKGKRPWEFCFNPACPTNKEWANKSAKYNSESKLEKTEQA